MQNKKDSAVSSHSTCTYVVGCPSWENSTGSHVQQSNMSESLILKMGVLPRYLNNTRQLSFQFQDQDSSSTQSTCQSYPEVASAGDSTLNEQSLISASSGGSKAHRKLDGGHAKLAFSMRAQEYGLAPSQVDYIKSIAHIPLPYADPYFSSVASPYAPQAMIQPRTMGVLPARVPLPLELTQDGPIYVNAKQYQAILRRRQNRAKLEAQNKLIKARKPYLHESRHLHALKRARGSSGRFLNTKKLQESNGIPTSNSLDMYISQSEVHQLKNYKDTGSTTSNNDEMFQHLDFRFSAHPSHVCGPMPGLAVNMQGGGNVHRHL
ncbi:nuclear transcription factor Y subunit A-3-like [Hibiscus syriacus]|uniref:nuclear transcription factor Y subunit A-3-like n=1 Tax=Hibiscus syriacus TaxID=106335 RepID=UPI001921A290|nr:nuclear transcription factor Y subunit A-3-like [Hibiscus syriacus]